MNVTNAAESSSIVVRSGGEFNIRARNSDAWSGGGAPAFIVTNLGTVTVLTDNRVKLGGDYRSGGLTHVLGGTFEHLLKTEQTSGKYSVDKDAIAMAGNGNGTLEIKGGDVEGGGKIDARLTLGYDPNVPVGPRGGAVPSTPVAIHPLIAQGETLTITGNLVMFSDSVTTAIDIDAAGKFSKIVVKGAFAQLNDGLEVNNSSDYRPDSGTLSFLTAPVFVTDFTRFNYATPCWITDGAAPVNDRVRAFRPIKGATVYQLEVYKPN